MIAIIISQHYRKKRIKIICLTSVFVLIAVMLVDSTIMMMADMKFSLFRFFSIITGSGSLLRNITQFDIKTMIFFVIALLISYIIFWNSFVIPKIKHRFITIIIGSFVLVSYLST